MSVVKEDQIVEISKNAYNNTQELLKYIKTNYSILWDAMYKAAGEDAANDLDIKLMLCKDEFNVR